MPAPRPGITVSAVLAQSLVPGQGHRQEEAQGGCSGSFLGGQVLVRGVESVWGWGTGCLATRLGLGAPRRL